MANCKICGQPVTAAPVFHPACWQAQAEKVAAEFCRGLEVVRSFVDNAVPVVRCKDCKRCTETEHGLACGHALPTKGLEQYLCFGTDILALVKPDDFCSYGERKDGAEDAP